MSTLELDNKAGLHPLPGRLADRVLAQSGCTGIDALDRRLVLLSKRSFIVTNALTSGPDDVILEKLALFKEALQEYLLVNEQHVYLPLSKPGKEAMSPEIRKLIVEFMQLKHRLNRFINLDQKSATSHRALTAKAICRIDRLIVQRCAVEHEVLYPALNRL